MSSLCFEPVTEMVLRLRDRFGLRRLVETGTFHGKSAVWAAQHFAQVETIEIRPDLFMMAATYHKGVPNITFHFGDSRSVLPKMMGDIREPALFWLDGHNDGQLFGDGPDDCPVMEELSAIFARNHGHCVLIDDANCFTAPHGPVWPQLELILERATEVGYVAGVAHNVIVLVPRAAEAELRWFLDFTSVRAGDMDGHYGTDDVCGAPIGNATDL